MAGDRSAHLPGAALLFLSMQQDKFFAPTTCEYFNLPLSKTDLQVQLVERYKQPMQKFIARPFFHGEAPLNAYFAGTQFSPFLEVRFYKKQGQMAIHTFIPHYSLQETIEPEELVR